MKMSKASQYQNLARQEYKKYTTAIHQKSEVNTKISRLETAKTDLTSQIENFQTQIVDMFSKIEGEDESRFKGDHKNKYSESYDSAKSAAMSNKTSHDTNLTSITNKIEELQAEATNLQTQANTAMSNRNRYLSLANSASST